eukprot:13635725-Heterocapsa_arctica.AAC.1
MAAFRCTSTLIKSTGGAKVQPLMPGVGHAGLPTSWMLPSKHCPHFSPLAGLAALVTLHLEHLNPWRDSRSPVASLIREILRKVSTRSA